VILAAKILARLLVISGPAYMKKFVEKTGGTIIMQYRLKRWWNIPTIWPISFAIFFGKDIAAIDLERTFDLYNLLECFEGNDGGRIACPEMLPVLTGMLQSGLKSVTKDQGDPESPFYRRTDADAASSSLDATAHESTAARSMSLDAELASLGFLLPLTLNSHALLMMNRLDEVQGTTPCRIRFVTTYGDEVSLRYALQVPSISRFCRYI
jgi:beige protein homolog 1